MPAGCCPQVQESLGFSSEPPFILPSRYMMREVILRFKLGRSKVESRAGYMILAIILRIVLVFEERQRAALRDTWWRYAAAVLLIGLTVVSGGIAGLCFAAVLGLSPSAVADHADRQRCTPAHQAVSHPANHSVEEHR